MDHLAQDLTVALEESESCGPIALENSGKWGMRRRTRSAGNLRKYDTNSTKDASLKGCILDLYLNRPGDHHSDESSSSNSEMRTDKHRNKLVSFHQSDSDDMSLSIAVAKALNQRTSLRMKHPIHNFLRGTYRLHLPHPVLVSQFETYQKISRIT